MTTANPATTYELPRSVDNTVAMRNYAKAVAEALALTDDPTLPGALADALARREAIEALKTAARPEVNGPARILRAPLGKVSATIDQTAKETTERAATIEVLKTVTDGLLYGLVDEAIDDTYGEIVQRLTALYDRAIADLIEAAKRLPGADPLGDGAGVLAAGAADAWTAADRATDSLLAISGALSGPRTLAMLGGPVPPALAPLLPLVDIADLGLERVAPFSGETVEPPDSLARFLAVRAFVRDVKGRDYKSLLVRVARGDFDGVSFALAQSTDEHAERRDRIDDAHRQQPISAVEVKQRRKSFALLPR